jgi:uncharacterized surface protein with fasciclin (FAS1) repeats
MIKRLRSAHCSLTAVAAMSLFALGACSSGYDQTPTETAPTKDTLAEAIAATPKLGIVAGALVQTGLGQVFDGASAYTILAPDDAAFKALGKLGEKLQSPANRAAMAAILRDHTLPGYVTPADIETALKNKNGPVEIETMGNHTLTFSQSGNGIEVTNEDGSNAELAGPAVKASNGVAIPIDGLLKKVDAAALSAS